MGSKILIMLALAGAMLVGCLFALHDYLRRSLSMKAINDDEMLDLLVLNDSVRIVVFSD
jgi:hypothetical protein